MTADDIRPMQTCAQCQTEFRPRRSTAKFCGDRCRKAASRGAPGEAPHAFLSVTGHPPSAPTIKPAPATLVTLTTPIPRASKLDSRIVPDAKWPGMYRLRRPDGSLSMMVNLTRAKDA